jgi:hypothetical protein
MTVDTPAWGVLQNATRDWLLTGTAGGSRDVAWCRSASYLTATIVALRT